DHLVLPCMRQPLDRQSDLEFLLKTLGALWLGGVDINWTGFSAAERRHRGPLPTYPFQRQRYWMSTSPDRTGARTSVLASGIDQHEPINGQDIEQLEPGPDHEEPRPSLGFAANDHERWPGLMPDSAGYAPRTPVEAVVAAI